MRRAAFFPILAVLCAAYPAVAAKLRVRTEALPAAQVATPYSATLQAGGGKEPYTWSIAGGALPAGLALASTSGVISGTPAAAGGYSFTVRVRDKEQDEDTQQLRIVVAETLAIATGTLPGGAVGQRYTQTLSAAGGITPYQWTVSTGSLPPGLSLDRAKGVIAGTPSSTGNFAFTVQVMDSAGVSAARALSIAVIAALTVTTESMPSGAVGAAYLQTLAAAGGASPYTWAIAGALPPGLSLNGATIAGTPTAAGTWRFTARVTEAGGAGASRDLAIAINPAALLITTASLPSGAVGAAYAQSLTATGGAAPYSWSIAGTLPPGLSLSGASVAGAPTAAGTWRFTARVTDANNASASRDLFIAITAATLQITTAALAPADIGVAYAQPLAAAGGIPPYAWSVTGALPPGLALTGSSIAGTPSSAGFYSFSVQVADAGAQTASRAFTLPVQAELTITSASLPDASPGAAYSQTLAASGGAPPYSWSIVSGALPEGITLNSSTGLLSGIPSGSGTFTFTAQVRDSAGRQASHAYRVETAAGLLITTAPVLPAGMAGKPYEQTLAAAGGRAPYTWSVTAGALPPGLALDPASGVIAGTPSGAGAFGFTVLLRDAAGLTASAALAIAVNPPQPPSLTITGGADVLEPLQQPAIAVSLAAPFPAPITGELLLTFEPDAAVAADDPAIQFSTGGRRAAFSIPANTTAAQFSVPSIAFQTGTVAGTIRLTAGMNSGDPDLTPPGGALRIMRINRSEPKIRATALARTASGFEVRITGLATSRELASANVKFQGGSGLETTELDVPLADLAARWYQDPAGAQFGSLFTLVLPFTVNGDPADIQSVTVTLVNQMGASQPATARF